MTDTRNLPQTIRNIAWGYLLLHLNFSLGTLNILPDWAAYLIFFSGLAVLCKEDESAGLLRPLCIILALWEIFLWFSTLIGLELNATILQTILNIVSLYFHFQFLTNIADIAQRYDCPQSSSIRTLRTIRTVLSTLLSLPLPFDHYEAAFFILLIILLTVCIVLAVILFSLKNSLGYV